MTIRYSNDLVLTDLARQIKNEHGSLDCYMQEGNLDGVFLRALRMQKKLDKLMERLNEIKYLQKEPA